MGQVSTEDHSEEGRCDWTIGQGFSGLVALDITSNPVSLKIRRQRESRAVPSPKGRGLGSS